jgi:fructokinase
VAWDNIPFTPEMEVLARKTQTVCFGSLAQRNSVSRATINRFLDCVPETALKIFDINLRQHFYTLELIEHALDRCNILKINDDEVLIVGQLFGWESKSELEICNQLLHSCDLKMVVLTKGTEGSYVVTQNRDFVQTNTIGYCCRHGRCRRLLYSCFCCFFVKWTKYFKCSSNSC